MSKKLNRRDRKKLIEASESGESDGQLKKLFGIKDNRTLVRHLKLAEQEERSSRVDLEIIKDAKADHLAKIRTFIELLQLSLVIPQVDAVYPGTSSSIHDIEVHPLYGSLREHLPFPTLWRDYSVFCSKMTQYLETCKNLREETRESWKIQDTELTAYFEDPILRLAVSRNKELRYRLSLAVGHQLGEFKYQLLDVNGIEVVRGREIAGQQFSNLLSHEQCSKETLPSEYQKIADHIYNHTSQIEKLSGELKKLEIKLHQSLQEIQLRHDYIMYTCKLCPGQPRLLR